MKKMQNESIQNKVEGISQEFTVRGASGGVFSVSAGQLVTITDLEGEQIVDFLAFVSPNHQEHLSVTHTRFNLRRLFLREGDVLLTNLQNPIIEIVKDTVGYHDMTAPSCDPTFYKNFGGDPNHRSCRQNFAEVLAPYGIENWRIPDPLNLFQNTPDLYHATPNDNKELTLGNAASKPNDYITFRFLTDAIFAVSTCPFDMFGVNGGKSTSAKVSIHQ